MKSHLFILVGLCSLGLYSCSETNKTKEENALLREKVLELEYQIEELSSESIVIPYDSITNFMIPTTFHPEIIEKEKGEFRILLGWRKFPEDIKLECIVTSENARIKEVPNDGLYRDVEVEFNTTGEKLIEGYYSITFPNGMIKKYDWRAYPNVIKK